MIVDNRGLELQSRSENLFKGAAVEASIKPGPSGEFYAISQFTSHGCDMQEEKSGKLLKGMEPTIGLEPMT
jgi:hypothetical protein